MHQYARPPLAQVMSYGLYGARPFYESCYSLWPSDAIQRHIDLGQHWLRWWLVAWKHQAITWTKVDLSVRFSTIQLKVTVLETLMKEITTVHLKIYTFKIKATSSRGQWVNMGLASPNSCCPVFIISPFSWVIWVGSCQVDPYMASVIACWW